MYINTFGFGGTYIPGFVFLWYCIQYYFKIHAYDTIVPVLPFTIMVWFQAYISHTSTEHHSALKSKKIAI